MAHIKSIHITIMLSMMVHAAFLYEIGSTASAGKQPKAQPSRMIYIQANLNSPADQPQLEREQRPESLPEPAPLIQSEHAGNLNPLERTEKKKIAKRIKPAKASSTATQAAAPLQKASMIAMVKTQQSYILQALEKIEEQKSYPMRARRRRISGSVTLAIRVSTAGKIEKLECLNGAPSLCQAAINAAEKAQPFAALPKGTRHLAFEYQMQYKLH